MIFKFRNLETGQAIPIPPGEYSIGRDDQTHIHLEDLSASRVHAFLHNQDGQLFIEDNGSANGTMKDNEFISGRVPLKLGDILYIGSVPFRVDPELLTDAGEPVPRGGQLLKADKTYIKKQTERIPAGPRGLGWDTPEEPVVLRRSTAAVPVDSMGVTVPKQVALVSPRVNQQIRPPQNLYSTLEIPPPAPFPWGMVGLAFMTGAVLGLVLGILMARHILDLAPHH